MKQKKKPTVDPRARRLKETYGITVEQWDGMFTRQRGKCPICLRGILRPDDPSGKRAASVDHDHKTGRVRGLLCYRCNRFTIGRLRKTDQLKRVISYLESSFDGRTLQVDKD